MIQQTRLARIRERAKNPLTMPHLTKITVIGEQ